MLQAHEDVSSFIASIRELVFEGYPTADQATRETIELRHFLKGLPNPEMVLAVGMCDPKTIDEAQICVNTYTSLQDDAVRPPQVKAVQVYPCETNDSYVTRSHMKKMMANLGKQLMKSIENEENRPPKRLCRPTNPKNENVFDTQLELN